MLVIGALGIVASVSAKNAITAAFQHGDRAKDWWNTIKTAEEFPPIAGPKPTYKVTTGELTDAFVYG